MTLDRQVKELATITYGRVTVGWVYELKAPIALSIGGVGLSARVAVIWRHSNGSGSIELFDVIPPSAFQTWENSNLVYHPSG